MRAHTRESRIPGAHSADTLRILPISGSARSPFGRDCVGDALKVEKRNGQSEKRSERITCKIVLSFFWSTRFLSLSIEQLLLQL